MSLFVTHNTVNDPANLSLRHHERWWALTNVAGVLVAQDDVDEALNKAANDQLEDESAHERAKKAEIIANEIRQSNRELLKWLRNLERQVCGHAQAGTQPRPMSSARRARREGRSTFKTQHSASEPDHGA